jgi:hypothetical protein
MQGCNVSMQGTGGGHIGFRFGQYNDNNPADPDTDPYTDLGSNISGTTLLNCTINGDQQGTAPSSSIGMQFGGGQVKPNRVIGCAVSSLGCDYLAGSITTTLSPPGVSASQTYLPVNDVTLFKRNGSNTRYVVIGLSEICTYTGVTNELPIPAAPSLSLISGTSNGAAVYVVITYVDTLVDGTLGETIRSAESTMQPTEEEVVQVSSPAPSGDATAYKVYVGSTTGGPYYLQNTSGAIPIGTAYTIPGTPLSPPSSTTQPGPTLSLMPGSSTVSPVYIVLTYVDQYGETTGSTEFVMTPPSDKRVQVSVPTAFGDATGCNVYVGSASGGPYYLQNTTGAIAIGADYLIPGGPYTPATQPPVVNTTGGWTGSLTGVTRGVLGTTTPPDGWPATTTVQEYQLNVGVYPGGDAIVWVGCGGSRSLKVFYLQTHGGNCYSILGGRWEMLPGIGQRFLQTDFVDGVFTQSITVKGVQLAGFNPPFDGNGVIWLQQNINLEWTGGAAVPQSGSYMDGTNGYFLTNNNSYYLSYGAVNFRNFVITANAPPPLPWNIINPWTVDADLLLVDPSGAATGRYRQIQMASPGALGFFGATPVEQQTMGVAAAGSSYGSNEQNMLQTLWNVLRAFGFGN